MTERLVTDSEAAEMAKAAGYFRDQDLLDLLATRSFAIETLRKVLTLSNAEMHALGSSGDEMVESFIAIENLVANALARLHGEGEDR